MQFIKKTLLLNIFFSLFFSLFSQNFSALNSGTGSQLNGIHFVNDIKGVAVGNGGEILTTSNGINWIPRNSGVPSNLTDVKYINSNTIIAVGFYGTILKSTNSGLNWSTIYPGGSYHLLSVYINGTDLYATGQNGVIIKSTDEGTTWNSVNPGTGGHIFKVFFTSAMIGYAVGNNGYIHKTTNGGTSWTYNFDTSISADFQLRSIYFTDVNNGYIVGRNSFTNESIFIRTTDGGTTWIPEIVYGTYYVDIEFLNSDTGFIISQNESSNTGVIFKTINGGISWTFLCSISKSLTDITFPSINVGYTCGFNGIIYKSTNIALDVEELESDQALSVYPNPSSEKIEMILHPSINIGILTIQFYSISGEKLISQLYADSIDISKIPAGVYFLKIQNETNSWTKKIIKE